MSGAVNATISRPPVHFLDAESLELDTCNRAPNSNRTGTSFSRGHALRNAWKRATPPFRDKQTKNQAPPQVLPKKNKAFCHNQLPRFWGCLFLSCARSPSEQRKTRARALAAGAWQRPDAHGADPGQWHCRWRAHQVQGCLTSTVAEVGQGTGYLCFEGSEPPAKRKCSISVFLVETSKTRGTLNKKHTHTHTKSRAASPWAKGPGPLEWSKGCLLFCQGIAAPPKKRRRSAIFGFF